MLTFRGTFDKQIWVWKGGFQMMQILGLLDMYFDAAVVFVTNYSLLFRLAMAILWLLLAKISILFYFNEFKTGDFEFSSVSGYPFQKLLY